MCSVKVFFLCIISTNNKYDLKLLAAFFCIKDENYIVEIIKIDMSTKGFTFIV